MTTVDIEAIRERAAHLTEALDRLVSAPNPGHAGQAHAAAVASATDVPLLLNELERSRRWNKDVVAQTDIEIGHLNAANRIARTEVERLQGEIDRLVSEIRNLRG